MSLSIIFWIPIYCIIKNYKLDKKQLYSNVNIKIAWKCDSTKNKDNIYSERVHKYIYILHVNFYAIKFIQTQMNKLKKIEIDKENFRLTLYSLFFLSLHVFKQWCALIFFIYRFVFFSRFFFFSYRELYCHR